MSAYPPSKESYGWTSAFPLATLLFSQTARARGISNEPTATHKANLSLASNFLGKIPFSVRVSSGYRSHPLNVAVGGAGSSQHLSGLAIDVVPNTMSNKDLAEWLYQYRGNFPELDQVIWYRNSDHLHIGICPPGAKGCARSKARGEFLVASKEGGTYYPWAPTKVDLARQAALFATNRPLKTGAAVVLTGTLAAVGIAGTLLGVVWLLRKKGIL